MAYELKRVGKQKVRYNSDNSDNPLVTQLLIDGAKVTPTSATVSIYSTSSTTAIIEDAAVTKSGSLLKYSVDTTTTASYPLGAGYRAEFAITYSSDVYPRIVVFDVVAWVLDLAIGFDQLVAVDDAIRGMQHDGDSDFNSLIQSARDYLQTRIERKVIDDNRLLENMILDSADVAIPMIFRCLYMIHFEKGRLDRAEVYRRDFESELTEALNSIRYDTDQDEVQEDDLPNLIQTRFVP